ncbi:MAG TPA: divalent metal cation transporter [Ktedonobacteraceae bacterium]|nr:divalent metal cation transporter [Ktedonobacteraceae bacterium]
MKQWLSLSLGIVTAMGGFLDAGTIATAGEAGARFGLGLIWAVLLATLAVMLLVEMAGRFSAVSQKPYAAAIRENFGMRFFLLPLCSEMIAESLLLTAELGGMSIAVSLVTGLSWRFFFPCAALLVFLMAWRAPFDWIENAPALLGLVTLSFVVAVFVLGGPSRGLWSTLWRPEIPQGDFAEYLYLVAAILGSTISPYLLYFYSSGALEEGWSGRSLLLNRVTAYLGMSFGALGSLALIVLGGMGLRPLHLTGSSLSQLVLPLRQAFGPAGPWLFALGLFATCLGAAFEVVLGLSYMIAQGFGWEWGENKPPVRAARFNLTIIIVLCVALLIGSLGIDPLRLALFASTIIALLLPFSLSPFLVLMNAPAYIGGQTNGRLKNLAMCAVLIVAFLVALISLPLVLLNSGG